MRRLLGSLLPVLLLAISVGACGDDDSGGVAQDPERTSPASPTSGDPGRSDGSVDFKLVDTVTVTAAGGQVSRTAVPMSDATDVEAFVAQFSAGDMATQVQDTVTRTEVPDGQRLYAAVVAIGCDAPDQVAVTSSGSGLVITALKVSSPQQECFAPMTTVALVLVPASAVG